MTGAGESGGDLPGTAPPVGAATPPEGDAAATSAPPFEPSSFSLGASEAPGGPGLTEAPTRAPESARAARTGEGTRDVEARVPGRGRLGLYEIQEEIGRGGMGSVYRAWHPIRRSLVALKVISAVGASDEKFAHLREMFLREGAILMSLAHENVVRCMDANEANLDGRPTLYMALELLEGETLADRIARGPLPIAEALSVVKSIARALEALHTHSQAILHRDVKPANVFLTRGGVVKLLDFGLAALADWRLTRLSIFAAGSRPYMAPEQFEGLRFCTERSDLYSLGVTMFQMVARRCPFEAPTDQGFLEAHKSKSPPRLIEANPKLVPDRALDSVQNIVTKLLAKRPDERYASARELIAAIERAEGGSAIERPSVTRPETVRLFRMTLTVAGGAAAIAVIVLAALAIRSSGIPRRLEHVKSLVSEYRFDEADRDLRPIRADAPGDRAAEDIARRINEALERRGRIARRGEGADALRAGGRALECAIEAEKIARDARGDGVFSPAELRALEARAGEAEAARARACTELFDRARKLLRAGGDLEAAAGDLAHAEALARTDAERSRLEALGTERAQRAALATASIDLGRGEIVKARSEVDALGRAPPLAELAEPLRALEGELRALEDIGRDLDSARALLGSDREAALERATRAEKALEAGGPDLERRAGRTAREARDLARSAARALAIDRLRKAEAASPEVILALVAAARALGPFDPADEAFLGAAEERASGAAFASSIAQARAMRAARRPPEVARSARDALRALRAADASTLRALAQKLASERRDLGVRRARARLRDSLRASPRAEQAWLLLEWAAAAADLRPEECLVERMDSAPLGSDNTDLRNPPHRVDVAPFFIDRTEVTARRMALVASGTARLTGIPLPAPSEGAEDLPVRGLSWTDARACAAALGKRLPSTDEWEVAASISVDPRGAFVRREFPWGDEWNDSIVPRSGEPRPAGSCEADVSPAGARDMGGNVAEWTTGEGANGADVAVLKGGSFSTYRGKGFETFYRAARRRPFAADERAADRGLRCARDTPVPDLSEFAGP